MGKQINYWLGYTDFLQIAQAALDCGCVIIKSISGELVYGQTLDTVTEDEHRYYFYLPEAGKLLGKQIPFHLFQRAVLPRGVPAVFADNLRFIGTVSVPGNLDINLTKLGLDCLLRVAVAAVGRLAGPTPPHAGSASAPVPRQL